MPNQSVQPLTTCICRPHLVSGSISDHACSLFPPRISDNLRRCAFRTSLLNEVPLPVRPIDQLHGVATCHPNATVCLQRVVLSPASTYIVHREFQSERHELRDDECMACSGQQMARHSIVVTHCARQLARTKRRLLCSHTDWGAYPRDEARGKSGRTARRAGIGAVRDRDRY